MSKHGRNIDTNLHFRSRENGVTGVNERIVGKNEEGKEEEEEEERLGGYLGWWRARGSKDTRLFQRKKGYPSPHY